MFVLFVCLFVCLFVVVVVVVCVFVLVLVLFLCVYALLLLQANTFQAVIATDGLETFVLFIYADIEWGDDATVGFNAGDSVRSIVVITPPLDLETGSNVGVTGLYINRVDLFDPTDGEKIKLFALRVTKNLFGMST